MFCKNTLEEKYSLGERCFVEVELQQVDLENIFLSRIDMQQANLDGINLKNADLSDANLTESSLVGAELTKAHLTGINLSQANLSKAIFANSVLTQANFKAACLEKASLMSAVLIEADFSQADLSGADLSGANLTSTNLQDAIYDNDTKFPMGFDPKARGMQNKSTVEDLVEQLGHLCNCSNKYLGNTMTAKYFNSSRPDYSWLNQFTIDNQNQIVFQGNLTDKVTIQQFQAFEQWLNSFTKSCSMIIKDFKKFV